jgi:hypothetical protein
LDFIIYTLVFYFMFHHSSGFCLIFLMFIMDPFVNSSKFSKNVNRRSPNSQALNVDDSESHSNMADVDHKPSTLSRSKRENVEHPFDKHKMPLDKLKLAFKAKLKRAASTGGNWRGNLTLNRASSISDTSNNSTKKTKSGSFAALGISKEVIKGLYHAGYKLPTPVQRRVIPPMMQGHDVVAMARTGSGKTAAFLVPAICRVMDLTVKGREKSRVLGLQCLVLEPTRELALQTFLFCKKYAKFTPLTASVVTGGESLEAQFAALAANPEVLVATPGRLMQVRPLPEPRRPRVADCGRRRRCCTRCQP